MTRVVGFCFSAEEDVKLQNYFFSNLNKVIKLNYRDYHWTIHRRSYVCTV